MSACAKSVKHSDQPRSAQGNPYILGEHWQCTKLLTFPRECARLSADRRVWAAFRTLAADERLNIGKLPGVLARVP